MTGTARIPTANWEACRQLCFSNPFCEHFGYWPDGGCHQQGSNATLVSAADKCKNTTNCSGLEVISGPRDLSMVNLWPKLSLSHAAEPVASTAAPDAVDDGIDMRQSEASSGGSSSVGWVLGVIALLAIVGGLYAAYSMGLFGENGCGDYDEYSDAEGEDPEEQE